ncbi:extracellular solute-binding protein [Demequina lignilytica]|uniref:ABC transporter substrate-binding protein n=1 Tax=Demequina lignilytica TaxID=3051663 RepID=A0AAW7M230_9MICO|nr:MULTISPECIES: extracellular solute-binding protein [unclassified Demequina]MDN4477054.1 ABC transporter substrate-binding protein [Demequina sp. SYSU T00039-1]MDN4483902.1 ABC transporter substrate-binding protein [Demequina sp. SYSU T0a273]MDN4487227.1 ABC transporter substrate-binding protein [Demequina sp. SYSU T00039]MDN4491778.1 ABC transporter substrate-binding protein [Demequina sp. SYSU T00068]
MKLTRTTAAFAVAAVVTAGALASCSSGGGSEETPTSATGSETGAFPTSWDEEITIDVFAGLANYMGMQQGWFAKIVKDKFNMNLNIIAPNVAGGGDTLYNTRVAAGELGDLIVTDKGQKLDELIQGGLVGDMSEYYPLMENVGQFDTAMDNLNAESGGVYAFPTSVSHLMPTDASEGLNPTFGPFIRWDYYAEQGYPSLDTLEDLLPVLKQMQEDHPTGDNGQPTYGFSLFKDWDGNMMVTAKQPACFYGYDEIGFVLAKADGSDYQSILDSDSEYVRSLRLYFDANQMGLVDPESTTQNYDTLYSKFQNGQVLFAWWPWLAQTAYNTEDNMAAGKGFEIAPVDDMEVFSYGAEAYGGKQVFAIGSKAEDPERIAAFVDWLYSPEGAYANSAQTLGSAGPQGLTWDINDAGEPELTEFGNEVFLGGGATTPEEWGGGDYLDGVSALNTISVLPIDVDPNTGFPYSYTFWPSYQEATATPLSEDWSANMGDATSTMDYLSTNDKLLVAPGASFTIPTDSSEVETLRNQIKAIVIQYSWQMVFASDEAQFESLLKELQDTANGLGYEKVLETDMANAEMQNDARVAVTAAFQ